MAVVLESLASRRSQDFTLANQLTRQAARIAINRTVAGVHFPVDSIAGAMLGLLIGQYVVALVDPQKRVHSANFRGPTGGNRSIDFETNLYLVDANNNPLKKIREQDNVVTLTGRRIRPNPNPLVAALWQKAKAEWPR